MRRLNPAKVWFGLAGFCLLTFAFATDVMAQERGELHGLSLRFKAEELPTDGFGEFACGSNGGPPRQTIEDWTEFRKCKPEASGLHEVYVRFDDQDEYVGRAINDATYSTNRRGTRVAGHPVILSGLFDDQGVLRIIRFLSDPRGDATERRMAHMLRLAVINRYDPADWVCRDIPPGEGESPVGSVYINSHCEKAMPERRLVVDGKFYRKSGQSDIDPVTREYRPGQFESSTRVEIIDPKLQLP